ncbi:SIR2 family protein [Leuconostoc mesenteroides]|uniref:SIR2 family protein n=1 Tax=Leuconostoc mesenteroides TaxID=1245 RepID=UPI002942258B|nr:SIR2 family protein [Leuconostoc mesenteroides]
MTKFMNKMIIKHINDAINNNSLLIFVGAGVSANSKLPSWGELISEFRSEMDIQETDYLKIAQYYFDSVGQQKYLQKILDIFQEHVNAQPNEIHDEIFRIKPRHIITTNYDSLLEQKMNSSLDKYEIIKKDSDIPYSRSDHYLIKMHGDLIEKNMVLKEDDYLDYETNFYMISTLIKSIIMNNTILFIGYSLGDSTFNSIFRLIQKGFSDNAKKAYFFTVDKQDSAKVQYFKNKGIEVFTNETNKEINKEEFGNYTVQFLKQLNSDKKGLPRNSKQLWKNIKFLDNLYFVDPASIFTFSKLKDEVSYYSTSLSWKNNSETNFNVSDNITLTNFLNNKTGFINFLDFKADDNAIYSQNPFLQSAYNLYKEHKYSEATIKFRELANEAFDKKDYWNYLLSEFNINHIISSYGPKELPESKSGLNNLTQVIDSLIINGDTQTQKIALYFRDEIQNFRFVYRKLFKINDLLDELRNERNNYRNGGNSFNNNLSFAKQEFGLLVNFIDLNCITIYQYKEFQQIVHRFFECLLTAIDNANYNSSQNNVFMKTSSIINYLSLDDVKNIVPHLKKENIRTLLENYGLSKVSITNDAKNYLLEKISKLSSKIDKNHFLGEKSELATYVGFLFFIKIDNINDVLPVLENYPMDSHNFKDFQKLLVMIIKNIDSMKEESTDKLLRIVTDQINHIFENDFLDFHERNFEFYSLLIQKIVKLQKKPFVFYSELLEEKFCFIDSNLNKISKIQKYKEFLVNFYNFLDNTLKKYVDNILYKYDTLDDDFFNYYFANDLIISKVNLFPAHKFKVLDQEVKKINDKPTGIYTEPDPRKNAISDIYAMIQQNYFTLDEVKEKLDFESIRGVFPEVDWTIFDDYSDQTITNFMKSRNFSNVQKYFGDTDEKRKRLNEWVLKQALDDNIRFENSK